MARTLLFDKDKFEVVYNGLLNSQRGFDAPSETRMVTKILDKMEKNAEAFDDGGTKSYRVPEGKTVTVELPDEEYKLLTEAIKAVKWTARVARKVSDVVEWLDKVEASS